MCNGGDTYEFAIVITNKVILVGKGCNQKEGIDFDKIFTPIARLEAIHILLASASDMAIKLF